MRPLFRGGAPRGGARPAAARPEGGQEDRRARLLALGTPAEVLARIVPEDALGLRARLADHLARRALLADVERLLLRAQALCALHAPAWRGVPELEQWLEARVGEAVDALLAEDAGTLPVPLPPALDAAAFGRACARFNRLPYECRDAFVALVLEGDAADGCARARGLSLSELLRRARAGLELFRDVCAPPAGSRETS